MPTPSNVRARGGRSLYGLIRVAAPFVLAIAALAAGVLWVSTGGGTSGAGAASPVTLSHGTPSSKPHEPSATTARASGPRSWRQLARRVKRFATPGPRRPPAPSARAGPRGRSRAPETRNRRRLRPARPRHRHRHRRPARGRTSSSAGSTAAPAVSWAAAVAAAAAAAAAAPGTAGHAVSALLGVSREAKGAAERPATCMPATGSGSTASAGAACATAKRPRMRPRPLSSTRSGSLRRGVVPRNELAWLLTIADNVCRSTRRTLGRRLAHVANADVDELEAAATSLNAETREEIAAAARRARAAPRPPAAGNPPARMAGTELRRHRRAARPLARRGRDAALPRHAGRWSATCAGPGHGSGCSTSPRAARCCARCSAGRGQGRGRRRHARRRRHAGRQARARPSGRTGRPGAGRPARTQHRRARRRAAGQARGGPSPGLRAAASRALGPERGRLHAARVRPAAPATATPAPPAAAPAPLPSPTAPSEDVTVPAPSPPAVAQPTTPTVPVTPPVTIPPISPPPVTLPPVTLPPVQLPPVVRDLPLPLP